MAEPKTEAPAKIAQGEKMTPTEMEVTADGKNVPVTVVVVVEREGGKKPIELTVTTH